MSVRRLADDAVQPQSFAFNSENAAWAQHTIGLYPQGRQQSAVIPLLWRAQEQEGWITRAAIEAVARLLSMPYIRVLEVATFYTQFLLKPVGSRAHILVCGTTPCMLRGAEDLRAVCEHRIHHDPLTVSADGTLSWEEVECLGACVNAPMIMIGNDTYEDLTVERFEEIVEAFAAGKGETVKPGPQIAREFSAAEGGATTLLEPPTAERTYKAFPPPPPPAPPAAGAPVAPAAPSPAAAAPAAAQAPTVPGKKRDVPEEAAPALKGPPGSPKVSEARADSERAKVNTGADGTPNNAMREGATGAESPAGKVDGGKAPGKPTRSAPGDGAASAGTAPLPPGAPEGIQTPVATSQISPTREIGGEQSAALNVAGGKKTPARLFEAPVGPRDDLKLISGVGPVLERTLNAIGITTYAQVAKLTPGQITQVEGELNFRGRVQRDKWLEQADALATGGVAEYVKRFGKDPR